jgi:plasmid stabilization system protein ParE
MRLVLHPKVHSDVHAIMEYYERVARPELADDFYIELRHFLLEAEERPESFSLRERDLRRADLHRFPCHFLFRIVGDSVRVLVVRHHRRRPSLGMGRQENVAMARAKIQIAGGSSICMTFDPSPSRTRHHISPPCG